jgi:sec-independent protein translocase protein TatA
MDLLAPRHLLVILLIAMVVFGTKKLRTVGSDLGAAIRGFKQAMKEGESPEPAGQATSVVSVQADAAPKTAIDSGATASSRSAS